MDNFDPYNVFLAIATNIPQQLMTGFVVLGHMWFRVIIKYNYITKYIYIYALRVSDCLLQFVLIFFLIFTVKY